MNLSISCIRIFFLIITMFFFSLFTNSLSLHGWDYFSGMSLLGGALFGALFAGLCIGLELIFKQFSLRAFVIATLGLFLGFLFSQAILLTFDLLLQSIPSEINPDLVRFLKAAIVLASAYFGVILTARSSDILPLINSKGNVPKRKSVILDSSILSDPRLIDLVNSGLLDQQLIMPKFAIKELHFLAENSDEAIKAKARKSLETLKKLESIKEIDLRFVDQDFPEIKDLNSKLTSLARQLECNILTAELNKIQQSELDGLKVININFLSQALKPITTAGEQILIKIQRFGKEPRQGIGYLDDGTMVVVNGGAEFIGETIKAIVLSVKSTTSGRMIFCNAIDDLLGNEKSSLFPLESEMPSLESYNT